MLVALGGSPAVSPAARRALRRFQSGWYCSRSFRRAAEKGGRATCSTQILRRGSKGGSLAAQQGIPQATYSVIYEIPRCATKEPAHWGCLFGWGAHASRRIHQADLRTPLCRRACRTLQPFVAYATKGCNKLVSCALRIFVNWQCARVQGHVATNPADLAESVVLAQQSIPQRGFRVSE